MAKSISTISIFMTSLKCGFFSIAPPPPIHVSTSAMHFCPMPCALMYQNDQPPSTIFMTSLMTVPLETKH